MVLEWPATGRFGQRRQRHLRIDLIYMWVLPGRDPWQRVQRQAVAHGRISGEQEHVFAAEKPLPAGPVGAGIWLVASLQRQGVADHIAQTLLKDASQSLAFFLIF